MKRREHLNLLITVLGGLGLAIAGCSLEKSSDYRSASHAASTSRALDGSASHENGDIAAASAEVGGPFRFVINLVHVRHRIPSEFLLVSKPQLVRIVTRDEKLAKTVDFSKGINVTLRFKKPDSESVELALLVFDDNTDKVSYLKSGEQVKFHTDGAALVAEFVSYRPHVTLALAQIVATPATELRHTDPPVSSRPVSYEEFFSQEQEAIAKEVLAKSEEVVAGYPPAITTDTKLSTFTDTATGMDGEITTDTVTSISTDTMTTITTTETMMTVEPVSPTEIATDPEVTGFTPK